MKALFYGASAWALSLALVGPVCAQVAAQSPTSTTTSPIIAPNNSTTPNTDAIAVGEVVVTAQKRTERLQDVPVAASVVSSAVLARSDVTDISDLNRLVPSVNLKATTNGRVPLAIRGVSTNANEGTIGLTQGVAIQLDGVPIASDDFNGDKLEDVAQVEVLKGPQATLGGRTASAGVINIVTQGPSDHFTGSASGVATGDGEYRGNLYVAGPLAQGLTFSLAGYGDHVDIPIHNDELDQQSFGEGAGARGKLRYEVGNFDVTFMGHYSQFFSRGESFTYQYLTPGAPLFPFIPSAFSAAGVPTAFGIPQSTAFAGINIGSGNTHYASPVHMFERVRDADGSITLNYHLNDLTLSSVTSYQSEHQDYVQDVTEQRTYFFNDLTDGMAPPYYNTQAFREPIDQVTQEVKITNPASRRFSYVAGVFYSSVNVTLDDSLPFVGNPVDATTESHSQSVAVYGRGTFKVTPSTSIVGGVRENFDMISFSKTQRPFQGCGDDAAGVAVTTCTASGHDDSNALVGDIALQQRVFGRDNVYVSYTHGYKPRAYNTGAVFAATALNPSPVGQEHIDSFEVGFKGQFLDNRLALDLDAFHTVYKNYQVQIFNNQTIIPVLELSNAGEARSQGVEFDSRFRLDANTNVAFNAAYIDARFLSFEGASCFPTQTLAQGCTTASNGAESQNLSGFSLPDSPKFKFNIDADHVFPLESVPFDLDLSGNFAYQTATLLQADQNPETLQNGFGILDLNLTAVSHDKSLSLAVFVNNVTDKFYLVNSEDFFSSLYGNNTANAVVGEPARDARRYAGVRLNYKF